MGLLILAFIGYLVAGAFGLSRLSRVLIGAGLACAPPVYLSWESIQYRDGAEELEEVSRQLRREAENYLSVQCALQSKPSRPVVVRGSEGVYLKSNGQSPPDIRDIPAASPQTRKSQEQHRRYGYSHPPRTNDGQYKSVLYWTSRAEETDFLKAGFAFVEYEDYQGRQTRSANFAWWQKNSSPEVLERLLRQYQGGKYLGPHSILRVPVEELRAAYLMEYRDVSTRQDRDNWLAKGSMKLSKRADDRTLAEYVGLAASNAFLSPGYGPWWEKVSVCSGTEAEFLVDGRWQPVKFFFSKVARIED